MHSIVLLTVMTSVIPTAVVARGPEILKIMVTIPMTGNDPYNGTQCLSAMQVAINAVNRNAGQAANILPDFHLTAEYQNDAAGAYGPLRLIEYYRQSTDVQIPGLYYSPIIPGFQMSSVCQRAGPILHHVGFVAFSEGCVSPIFTEGHIIYKNLYRIRPSAEFYIVPIVRYMKEIGKWNRVAVVCSTTGVVGYTMADRFLRLAPRNNLTIGWFDCVGDFTEEVITSIIKSDIRVIFFSNAELGLYTGFLCAAAKYGLTGPKYTFVSLTSTFMETDYIPEIVSPNGCTRKQLLTQYEHNLFIGATVFAMEDQGETALGYQLTGFNEQWDKLTNHMRPDDIVDKQFCHDAMLQTILTLDKANKFLEQNHPGFSLRNFTTDRDFIMKVVNQTVPTMRYVGIRAGDTYYSERLETDFEPIDLLQWSASRSWKIIYKLKFRGQTAEQLANWNAWELTRVNEMIWQSVDGNPPKDMPELIVINYDTPLGYFAFTVLCCAVLSVFQVFAVLKALIRRQIHTFSRCICFLGCLILNGGSIAFALPNGWLDVRNHVFCPAKITFVCIGMTLIDGYLIGRVLKASRYLRTLSTVCNGGLAGATVAGRTHLSSYRRKKSRASMSNLSSVSLQAPSPNHRKQSAAAVSIANVVDQLNLEDEDKQEGFTQRFMLFALAINAILLNAWFIYDMPSLSTLSMTQKPVYDPIADIYKETLSVACTAATQFDWAIVVALLHLLPLIVVCARSVGGIRMGVLDEIVDFKFLRLSIMNSATLILLALLIMFVIGTTVKQQITVSFVALMISASTSALNFHPLLIKLQTDELL